MAELSEELLIDHRDGKAMIDGEVVAGAAKMALFKATFLGKCRRFVRQFAEGSQKRALAADAIPIKEIGAGSHRRSRCSLDKVIDVAPVLEHREARDSQPLTRPQSAPRI